jgi:ribosomal protein S18 acetylase RimI-like enzyme
LAHPTTKDVCEGIIRDNAPAIESKLDLVVVQGAEIVGWGFLWDLTSDNPTLGLGIADAFHGRGLGTRLIRRIVGAARARGIPRIYLTVVQDNQVAWKLYKKAGFVRYGEFMGKDGLPYYRMVAELELEREPPGQVSSQVAQESSTNGSDRSGTSTHLP